MATTPDVDVATRLGAAGIGLTLGTNLFAGPVRAYVDGTVPHQSVFCLATGGPPPEPFCGDPTNKDFRRSKVQVRTRSNLEDFDGGQTLTRNTRNAIHKASVVGYVDVEVLESEPNYLGKDEDGHHEWSINVELMHRE